MRITFYLIILRRSRLSSRRIGKSRQLCSRTAFHHLFHQLRHDLRFFLAHQPFVGVRRKLFYHASVCGFYPIQQIRFHQLSVIGNGSGNHIQLKRRNLRRPLSDGGLHYIRVRGILIHGKLTLIISKIHLKLLIKQKLVQRFSEFLPIKLKSYAGKSGITGLGKGLCEIFAPVGRTVVAVNPLFSMGKASVALKRELTV